MKNILILFAFCGLLCGCCGKKAADADLSGYEPMEGDIVFRRGAGAKSRAVMVADPEGIYSHAGIVIRHGDGFAVVHIAPGERKKGDTADVIKLEDFDTFFSRRRAIKGEAMRFTDSTGCCPSAATHARRILESGVSFDHDYDLDDTVKMYCTELIWHCYTLAGRDISQGRRNVIRNMGNLSGTYIMPSDVHANPSLETVLKF